MDLFISRFNKLPLFVSLVLDPLVSVVDALSLPLENLDAYAFPPAAEVAELSVQQDDSDCTRVAQHALVLGPSDHV